MEISDKDRLAIEHMIASHYFHLFKSDQVDLASASKLVSLMDVIVHLSKTSETGFPSEFGNLLENLTTMLKSRYQEHFEDSNQQFFEQTHILNKEIKEVINKHKPSLGPE